jgi:hypothetical protein
MPKGPSGLRFESAPPKWVLIVPGIIGMVGGTVTLLRYHMTWPALVIIAGGVIVLSICVGAALWSYYAKRT